LLLLTQYSADTNLFFLKVIRIGNAFLFLKAPE
jgi:hypothetical protein